MTDQRYVEVRCPYCGKLGAEAVTGSRLRLKCPRCRALYTCQVNPAIDRDQRRRS